MSPSHDAAEAEVGSGSMRIIDEPARTFTATVGSAWGAEEALPAWDGVVSHHQDMYKAVRPWVPADQAAEGLPAVCERQDEFERAAARARSAINEAAGLLASRTRVDDDTTAVIMVGLAKHPFGREPVPRGSCRVCNQSVGASG